MNPEAQPYVGKGKKSAPTTTAVFANPTQPLPPPPPPLTGVPPGYTPAPYMAPVVSSPASVATKLRAVAVPFQPKGPSAPPPPPPEYPAASPLSSQKSTDSDGFKASLNVSATPYTPKKRSPTARGTPTFPDAPAPPMPVAAGLQPVLQFSESPLVSSNGSPTTPSVASPPSSTTVPPVNTIEKNPFAKSSLVVPDTPKECSADNKLEFHSAWSLWADDHPLTPPGEQKQFMEPVLIRDVADLASFWSLWWHCPHPSTCTPSWTYNWFRRLIKPVWEDPRNKNGGTISFSVYDHDKPAGLTREAMDDVFFLVIIGLSGESIPEASAVNGVSLKIRPHRPVVMQLWTNTSDKARLGQFVAGLRAVVQRVLPAKQLDRLEYFSHTRMHQHTQAASAAGNRFSKVTAKGAKTLEPDYTFRDTD